MDFNQRTRSTDLRPGISSKPIFFDKAVAGRSMLYTLKCVSFFG